MNSSTLIVPDLHDAQIQIWQNRKRFNTVCLGRRSGKTALGIMLVLGASFNSDMPIGMLQGGKTAWFAPSFRILDAAWREIKLRLAPIIESKNEQTKRLEISGGGSLELMSLDDIDAGRGRKYHRVIIDESAMCRNLKEAWENAIRPTLTDFSGDAWFLSSPKGRNYFYELHQRGLNGEEDWQSFQMPTSCNPFIDKKEIEEARRDLPERVFSQEYLAEFLDSGDGVFRNVNTCTYEIESVDTLRNARKIDDGRAYVIGVDLARVEDFTVITVIDVKQRKVVAIDRFNQIEYLVQLERLVRISNQFKHAPILIESNNTGIAFIEIAQRRGLTVRAFQTTNASKAAIIEKLAVAFEQQRILIPNYAPLVSELLAFDQERLASGAIRYSAPNGQHDDCVMSLAIAFSDVGNIGEIEYMTEKTTRWDDYDDDD